MTNSVLRIERHLLSIAVCGAGILLAWLSSQPSGLLVAVAGISILGRRWVSLLSTAVFGFALCSFIVVVGWDSFLQHATDVQLAVFLAVGLGISGIIYLNQIVSSPGHDEREARLIVESMPGHGWSADPKGSVYVSPKTLNYIGRPTDKPDRIEGAGDFKWRQVIHPEDYDRVAARWINSLKTGEPYETEHRIRRFDGTYRWFRNSAIASRDSHGQITGWYGTSIDIEDKKIAEFALREREQQLQQLIDAVPALIWSATKEGKPTYLNKRYTDVTGATLEDLSAADGSPAPLYPIHPDDRDMTANVRAYAFETGAPYFVHYRQIRRDGSYRWTETRAEPLRDESGAILVWYGVSVDIHDLVTAQDALRQSERRYRDLFHYMPIGLTQVDDSKLVPLFEQLRAQGVTELKTYIDEHPEFLTRALECLELEEVNQHIIEMFGAQSAAEMLGPIARYWQPDISTIRRSIEARYRGEEFFQEETKVARMDGSVIDVLFTTARPSAVANKSLVGFVDITERKKAEEALRERERALWQLVETLPAMIDCAAPNGEPVYRSQQLREFLGYNLEALDGKGTSRLAGTLDAGVHPDDLAGVKELYEYSLSTGKPYARRHRLRRFDGQYRWVETRAAPMRNAEGTIAQWNVIFLDIDGEVRAQDELRLAKEKMARASQAASLAELSASIAHEVNQPLAAIVATSHACRRWLSADPPNLERAGITLERIIRDANSASEVVSRIRALFSQMGKTRSPTDIAEVITEVSRLMTDELATKNIQVQTEFDESLPPAIIDRVQMQQVLVNLIRNAIDAFDTIIDGTKLIRLRAVVDGDNVIRVEVRDLGAGMKEPERVFEPFFTTKENGMGMGLAICRSIVESHNGRLWASSNQPRGTVFAFTLPIQTRDAA